MTVILIAAKNFLVSYIVNTLSNDKFEFIAIKFARLIGVYFLDSARACSELIKHQSFPSSKHSLCKKLPDRNLRKYHIIEYLNL